MSIQDVWAVVAMAIEKHGDEMAFEAVLSQINLCLEASDVPGAAKWRSAAIMIDELLSGLAH
ncbi:MULTISPECIES: hypothetical protein [unclassified Sphingomonas]|uniref:hypothetical protein n=1 Tax=unclassified Sphingomonas TaxID=196159 RepID=UPI00226A2C6B|nr:MULTISPECIES: hypothetical protein [unclassified Sphingomonas]